MKFFLYFETNVIKAHLVFLTLLDLHLGPYLFVTITVPIMMYKCDVLENV